MVIDWPNTFHYGMYRGHKVREVFDMRPTYLIWTYLNVPKNKFTPRVVNALVQLAHSKPYWGMSQDLVQRFLAKNRGNGPW